MPRRAEVAVVAITVNVAHLENGDRLGQHGGTDLDAVGAQPTVVLAGQPADGERDVPDFEVRDDGDAGPEEGPEERPDGTEIVVAGDERLFNPYGAIMVNPARHNHVQAELAGEFLDYLTSDQAKQLITGFRKDGEQLFYVSD